MKNSLEKTKKGKEMDLKGEVIAAANEIQDRLDNIRMQIWNKPEEGFHEVFASELLSEELRKNGFDIEQGCFGVPTAVRASYGKGNPVIGFLGEYDSLPGFGDKENNGEMTGFGHACGHNLIGTGMMGTAIVVKKVLEKNGLKGTVVFYGCPAEEKCGGKVVMASNGAFRELDCCIAWHPSRYNQASYSIANGVHSAVYHFKGISAHAAAHPEKGRSALDAVELMDMGANYLREHVTPDVRIHYVIKEGGKAPNVVPDRASVWYYNRALSPATMNDTQERLNKIAKGAALMTGTEVSVEEMGGCYPILPNHVLADVMDDAMRKIPQEEWTEQEKELAEKMNQKVLDESLHFGVADIITADDYGSTDVGDVSHIVPTTFFKTACYGISVSGHTPQVITCVGSSVGLKGMMFAIKSAAYATLVLMNDEQTINAAKKEFAESVNNMHYKAMLPDNLSEFMK